MNNEFIQQQAEGLSKRIQEKPVREQLNHAWLIALGRQPSKGERNAALAFMLKLGESSSLSDSEQLTTLCQALLCTSEFGSID